MDRLVVSKNIRVTFGCMYAATFGCMSMPFGCMSMDRLGACLTVGGLPDSRQLCLTVGSLYAETFGCMYAAVGGKFHTAESLPDSR